MNRTIVPSTASHHAIRQGMLMMVVGMLIIPGIDAIAKYLSDAVPSGQITASRFLFQTLFLAPFVIGFRRLPFDDTLWLHAARGFLIAAATLLFFTALRVLPLADAISIFFVEPLILTVLAALFLGESIGWRRVLAVLVGFAGALIIVRPSYLVFGWQALLPLGAAFCFAVYLVLTRMLTQRADPVTMQFTAGIFGGLTMTVALIAGTTAGVGILTPVWPSLSHWLLLALLGIIGTSAHMLVVMAFQRAPAGVLAPFQYLEIISATALGLLIFGDFPDAMTWLGITIIVGSGLYVFHREQKVARKHATAEDAGKAGRSG